MDAKLKCEESIKLLFEKIDAQEQKSKKLKEENKALNDTLSAYEDHIIFVQQKFRLVLNENCEVRHTFCLSIKIHNSHPHIFLRELY